MWSTGSSILGDQNLRSLALEHYYKEIKEKGNLSAEKLRIHFKNTFGHEKISLQYATRGEKRNLTAFQKSDFTEIPTFC